MRPEEISTLQTRSSVVVLSICDVIDALCLNDLPYMERGKVLAAWRQKHSVHYYARPREVFFIAEATAEAKAKGLKFVVVEDMS